MIPNTCAPRCPHRQPPRACPRVHLNVIALAGFLAAVSAPAAGQGTDLAGQVVDTAGAVVPGQVVMLHRVDGGGGARIAQATTDAQGRFSLSSPDRPVDDAVYFVAARVDGRLYLGPFLRAPFTDVADYTVVIGGEPVDLGSTALPLSPGAEPVPAQSPRRWLLALVPALALLAVALVGMARSRGPSERRRLLIRAAQLDNESGAGEAAPGDERARIVDRLLSLER